MTPKSHTFPGTEAYCKHSDLMSHWVRDPCWHLINVWLKSQTILHFKHLFLELCVLSFQLQALISTLCIHIKFQKCKYWQWVLHEWYYQNSFKEIQIQRTATHEKALQTIWVKLKYRECSQQFFLWNEDFKRNGNIHSLTRWIFTICTYC